MKIPFWHRETNDHAALVKAKADLAKLDANHSKSRADVLDKVAAVQHVQAEWCAVLAVGQAAAARVQNATEQLEILRDRHAVAAAKFDSIIGGDLYTKEWHSVAHADPLLNSWVYGTPTENENPTAYHARTLAALELGIDRIQKLLPGFEQAEADAREAAVRFAKANGITHDLA